jgi:hypothetical protein
LAQQNASTVSKDTIRAKWVRRPQFSLSLRVSPTHRAPANAGTDKCVDKPELEKITKAEREFIFYRFDFTLPNRIRMTNRRTAAKIITFQPPANFSDRNSGKSRSFGYSIKARI